MFLPITWTSRTCWPLFFLPPANGHLMRCAMSISPQASMGLICEISTKSTQRSKSLRWDCKKNVVFISRYYICQYEKFVHILLSNLFENPSFVTVFLGLRCQSSWQVRANQHDLLTSKRLPIFWGTRVLQDTCGTVPPKPLSQPFFDSSQQCATAGAQALSVLRWKSTATSRERHMQSAAVGAAFTSWNRGPVHERIQTGVRVVNSHKNSTGLVSTG